MDNFGADLPPAVTIFLHRMRSDPAQKLTYEMSGDGCSTSLVLTWTCLTCPGCQGARCPGRPGGATRRTPRPHSWALGGAFSYSSPEEEDRSLSPFSPGLSSTGDSGEEEEEDSLGTDQSDDFVKKPGGKMLVRVEVHEEMSDSEIDTGGDEDEEDDEQSDSSVITCRRNIGSSHHLDNKGKTDIIPKRVTLQLPRSHTPMETATSSSEQEEEQLTTDTSPDPDSESDSKQSSCMDSGLCLDYVKTTCGIPSRPHKHISSPSSSEPEPETSPIVLTDQGVQTEEAERLVKRCHAVWAALEQVYLYYDDKESVLRVSEVDSGQLVVNTHRTEATLRYLRCPDGQTLRVALEIIWLGLKATDS